MVHVAARLADEPERGQALDDFPREARALLREEDHLRPFEPARKARGVLLGVVVDAHVVAREPVGEAQPAERVLVVVEDVDAHARGLAPASARGRISVTPAA